MKGRVMKDLVYGMREAATMLKVSRRTLDRMIAAGELRKVKVRGRTLIPGVELQALLTGGKVVSR